MSVSGGAEGTIMVAEAEARFVTTTTPESEAALCPSGEAKNLTKSSARAGGVWAVSRIVFCCLRRLSPVGFVRRVRDCYVSSLNGCSQKCAFQMPHGFEGGHCSATTSLPPSLRVRSLRSQLEDPDFRARPFIRSFSEYDSCLSPTMRKTYSEAAGSCPPSGYCGSPNRGGMMIFPIEEAPEHGHSSFRKESGFVLTTNTIALQS